MDKHDVAMRWQVTIWYRSKLGTIDVQYAVEEISDVDGIVEAGPDWNTIEKIEITLARALVPGLTVEAADEL